MKNVRIKPELLSLLTKIHTESFNASELCAAYMKIPACSGMTKPLVQQFILRNLKRLERAGLIAQESGKAGKFKLTERFNAGEYRESSPHSKNESTETVIAENAPTKLTEQLSHHKLELLTTIGEVEEYESLSQQNPGMRASIQGLYNDARDRCSRLLGKVKATEALIALVQSQ